MSANVHCIRFYVILENAHDVFKCSHEFLIVKLVHQAQIAFQHRIKTRLNEVHCSFILQNLFQGASGVELHGQWLVFRHVFENAINHLLDVRRIFELHVSVDAVCLAGSGSHERLRAP